MEDFNKKEQENYEEVKQEVQQEELLKPENKKMLPLSICLSFVGAIVGLIPAILVVLLTGYLYGLLFAITPIAAFFGYKLGKAPLRNYTTVIVIIESLVVTALAIFVEYTILAAQGGVSVLELIAIPEAEFVMNLVQAEVFACIGIAVAWNVIRKINK